VLKEGKMYVLKDKKLKVEIIQLHHDVPVAGHGGKWKTTELVMRNYWWLEVIKYVRKYVEECGRYQRMKNRTEVSMGKLKLSEVLKKPWKYLMVDFIIKLLLVAKKDMILVVCDRLSKITYFVAMIKRTSAEGLARLFRDNVWKLHGLPKSIVSDRRLQFAVEMTRELNSMLEIKMKLSTVFHSQTDGQTERMNQELEQYLRFFIDHRQKNWPKWLALAEFAINNKIHLTTKVSPFMANYGRELGIGINLRRKRKVEKMMEFVKRMRRIQEEVEAALKRAQEEIKRQVDRKRKEAEEWTVEDKVMLNMKDLVFKKRLTKKLVD